jgi:hypothetical protein
MNIQPGFGFTEKLSRQTWRMKDSNPRISEDEKANP